MRRDSRDEVVFDRLAASSPLIEHRGIAGSLWFIDAVGADVAGQVWMRRLDDESASSEFQDVDRVCWGSEPRVTWKTVRIDCLPGFGGEIFNAAIVASDEGAVGIVTVALNIDILDDMFGYEVRRKTNETEELHKHFCTDGDASRDDDRDCLCDERESQSRTRIYFVETVQSCTTSDKETNRRQSNFDLAPPPRVCFNVT